MKVLTIANMKEVSEKARQEVPELADKVQSEYNNAVEKALTTKENNPYLTELQQEKVNNGKKQPQDFAKNIVNKLNKRYNALEIERLNSIMQETRKIKKITIYTDWKNNYEGNQCKATVSVIYDTYETAEYISERTSGGGYDKESTATKGALNQINALMQELCTMANEAIKAGKTYRDFIGYGSGYDNVPYFEGGVGFDCHRNILQKLGYKFEHAHSTKRTDLYIFTKE
jgi:hypothetical protein